ncbi:MAG: hypothetical protein NVS2B3_15810 [Vulcanimicrobiaceae bacterium]
MYAAYRTNMRWSLLTSVLAFASACTPGSFDASVVGSAHAPIAGRSIEIDVNLTSDPGGSTPGGIGGGYAPLAVTLALGDAVRFRNSDGFAHTATSLPGDTFPVAYPFTDAALRSASGTLSGGFSTGSLAAGVSSQQLVADRAGTYLYGCFYHYGSPMRAAIVVR